MRCQQRLFFAALAAVLLTVAGPGVAMAAGDPQEPGQPPPSPGGFIVEQVYNGPLFGAEFKFTEINGENAYLIGGYAGVLLDDRLFVGGAGYWQANSFCNDYGGVYGEYGGFGGYYGFSGCAGGGYDDYDDGYRDVNAYGGLVLEWYALRSSVVSVSGRGLIGGGVANLTWGGGHYPVEPQSNHGGGYPQPVGYYYESSNQGYFVFEPQVNVTLRFAPGVALVGGAGYRVIGWANGWEDQLDGFTATAAIRFGGR